MGHKERMKKNKGLKLILLCFLVICSATRANAGWRVVIDLKTTKAVATNAASQKIIEDKHNQRLDSISSKQQNALPNGLICLKGGELEHETMPFKHKTVIHNLSDNFKEEFFETKKVVYVPI